MSYEKDLVQEIEQLQHKLAVQKEIEKRLRESEARYRDIACYSLDLIYIYSLATLETALVK